MRRDTLRKLAVSVTLMLVLGLVAVSANADTLQAVCASNTCTVTGTNSNGNTVDAQATFTFGNGTVQISLTNLLSQSDISAVNQAITGLYFTLNNASGGSLTSSSGSLTNLVFNGGGNGSTATAAGSGSTHWILETVGIYDHLCVICSGSNSAAPSYAIIGGTGSGLYPNAGGSLGNTHSPFLYTPNTAGAVVYNLTIAGVNSDTTLGEVWIQFNTDLTGPTPPVPEPASMALLGTGLLGLAGGIRRKLGR